MQQADGIFIRIIGTETVGADEFGQAIGLMRRRHLTAIRTGTPHFGEAHPHARLRELPCGLRPGEAAANDVNLMLRHFKSP
jgi:hypothetical protein